MHPRSADDIIAALALEPLDIEGGRFREIYRSASRADETHTCATIIYYLLCAGERSRWHAVASDEVWVQLAGVSARQAIVTSAGDLQVTTLAPAGTGGCACESLVPAGAWQSTVLTSAAEDAWALFTCTVVPGFRPEDFTAGSAEELCRLFPGCAHELRAWEDGQQDP